MSGWERDERRREEDEEMEKEIHGGGEDKKEKREMRRERKNQRKGMEIFINHKFLLKSQRMQQNQRVLSLIAHVIYR